MTATNLATALRLRPLDRVQLMDRATLYELRDFSRMNPGRKPPPPFWFYQRTLDDGLMLLRSPGGYCAHVHPCDVADLRPRPDGPIVVQAMPVAVWMRRAANRNAGAPTADDYAPAHLLWARKDRWGRAEAYVYFLDPALNSPSEGTHRIAPLCDSDNRRLQQLATRRSMPVVSGSSANASADAGEVQRATQVQGMVARFIAASLAGDDAKVLRLATKVA